MRLRVSPFALHAFRRGLAVFLLAVAFRDITRAAMPPSVPAAAIPPPVPGVPIGWCILAKPEVFADAKSAGFEYVELALQGVLPMSDAEFHQLAGQLAELGLHARTGYNAIPKEIMLVGPQADAATQDTHLARLLARAAELKLEYLILNAGASWKVPEGFSRDQAFRQLTEFARRFASAAAAKNITVLVEPLRSTDSNMLTTIAEAVALVEAVRHPNFQMMVDYSFLRIQKDDVTALLKARGHLRHVHIANPEKNPRVYPMDENESDYASFFRVLKTIGYRGGISVHAGTNNFAAEAPRAIAFLRREAAELVAAPNPR
jgi:sugar phosphate isomerase/epimerase